MKALNILAIIFLIVGLIVGIGIGSLAFPKTVTMTKTETRTTSLTTTVPTTITSSTTIIETLTETVVSSKTLTQIVTETMELTTTIFTTKTVSTVVTTWPTFSPEGKIGEKVGESGLIFTVHSVEKKWKLGIFEPKTGNIFLVIDVEIQNVMPREETVSPAYMYIVDENGKRYGYSLASVALTGYLPGSASLQSGESIRGFAAFEIPQTATPKYFIYEVFGERLVTIALE